MIVNTNKALFLFIFLLTGFFAVLNFDARTEMISTDYTIGFSFSLQILLLIEFILICVFNWSQINLGWIDSLQSRIILKLDLFCCLLVLLVCVSARQDAESIC